MQNNRFSNMNLFSKLLNQINTHPRIYLPILVIVSISLWMALPEVSAKPGKVESSFKKSLKEKSVLVSLVKNINFEKKLVLQGEVFPNRRVNLRFETNGKVKSVLVTKGKKVKAGDVLLTLNIDDKLLKYEQAQAELEAAILDDEANQKLVTQGAKSKFQGQNVKANLRRAKTNLEVARLEYERTEIKAPFDGIIEDELPEIGTLVRYGDLVTSLADINALIVKAFVPQININDVHLDTIGKITSVTESLLNGKVRNISPVAKNSSRTFEIEFLADYNDISTLPLGSSARISLETKSFMATEVSASILSLISPPATEIGNQRSQLIVKIVDPNNKVKYIPVEIVQSDIDGIWVSGIPDNSRLIIRGAGFVTENESVNPVDKQENP